MKVVSTTKLMRDLRKQGYRVEQTTNGHYRARPPDKSHGIVHFSDSADPRAIKNTIKQLEKTGYQPSWEQQPENDDVNAPAQTNTDLNLLELVLAALAEVGEESGEQLLFEREQSGRWSVVVPKEYVLAEGQTGKGRTPDEACRKLLSGCRDKIRERIEQLQALEASLGQ